jgi:hypothetical protein
VTCLELARLIARRAIDQPDPVEYFSRAIARVHFIPERAAISGDVEAEVVKFLAEFGLLAPEVERWQS